MQEVAALGGYVGAYRQRLEIVVRQSSNTCLRHVLLSLLPISRQKAGRSGKESSRMKLLYGVVPAGLHPEGFRLEVAEICRQLLVQRRRAGLVFQLGDGCVGDGELRVGLRPQEVVRLVSDVWKLPPDRRHVHVRIQPAGWAGGSVIGELLVGGGRLILRSGLHLGFSRDRRLFVCFGDDAVVDQARIRETGV